MASNADDYAIPTGGDFVPIDPPKVGAHHGICCEVHYEGIKDTKFGKKRKIALIFWVNEKIEGTDSEFDGKWKEIRIFYNWSLSPNSRLRGDLESWRGDPITDDDLDEQGRFDIKKCEGAPATVIVGSWSEPNEKGRQYANDVTLLPADSDKVKLDGLNEMTTDGYVPVDERVKEATDFPPKDDAGSKGSGQKSGSKGGKKPAPF